MTNYRRNRTNSGYYFFTVVIANRNQDLLVRHIDQLRAALRQEQQRAQFANIGMVVLPDHLHTLWRLPPGDSDYSNRWRRIKAGFSRTMTNHEAVSASRAAKGERGIWQRRFWEHTIRDEKDLNRHLDYIHFNPVKHGLVEQVVDWPHSTFHEYVRRGVYSPDWGSNVNFDGMFGE